MRRRLYEQRGENGKLSVDLSIEDDSSIQVFFHDIGPAADEVFGDFDHEAVLTIPADHLSKLSFALLADRFGGSIHALSEIMDYCRASDIRTERWTF